MAARRRPSVSRELRVVFFSFIFPPSFSFRPPLWCPAETKQAGSLSGAPQPSRTRSRRLTEARMSAAENDEFRLRHRAFSYAACNDPCLPPSTLICIVLSPLRTRTCTSGYRWYICFSAFFGRLSPLCLLVAGRDVIPRLQLAIASRTCSFSGTGHRARVILYKTLASCKQRPAGFEACSYFGIALCCATPSPSGSDALFLLF